MSHVVLFTGHMIDEKERPEPRFPPGKEELVRSEILRLLVQENASTRKLLKGIAGGACGGDIIFHELCVQIGIQTEIYLALPIREYKKHSVLFAGSDWGRRFTTLIKRLPVHVLPVEKTIGAKNSIWAETNLWMLNDALKIEGKNMTLIALWDGKGGDGIGGTEHMINEAKDKGAKINIINIHKI